MLPRILFFDVETRKWASDLRPDDIEAGWDDLRDGKGGMSAVAVYDTRDHFVHLYDDHSVQSLARHLEAADLVVGYCSETFDIPCVEGLLRRKLRLVSHFDIYARLMAENAKRGRSGQKGDMKLDRIARQNLGRGKINHGSNAKELARLGKWGSLFNYCADDVHLTRDLFAVICRDGGLKNLNGLFTTLTVPEHFVPVMEGYL